MLDTCTRTPHCKTLRSLASSATNKSPHASVQRSSHHRAVAGLLDKMVVLGRGCRRGVRAQACFRSSVGQQTEGVVCDAGPTDARTSSQTRRSKSSIQPWAWGPWDRGGIDAEIPNPADTERIEPKHIPEVEADARKPCRAKGRIARGPRFRGARQKKRLASAAGEPPCVDICGTLDGKGDETGEACATPDAPTYGCGDSDSSGSDFGPKQVGTKVGVVASFRPEFKTSADFARL